MTNAIIVAYDRNRAIGSAGDLPWKRSLPADLARFKHLTLGGSVIMGRKTFESVGRRPLPERENIVVSSKPTGVDKVLTAFNLPSALNLARYPIFIIGGEQLYREALTRADIDTIYATEIQAEFENVDTFFPKLDQKQWREITREHHSADDKNTYDFDFVKYQRITPQSAP